MNILCDFVGHADLYYSMHALFVKRLGWNLFRPLPSAEWSSHGIITEILPRPDLETRIIDGFTEYYIPTHNYWQRCVSFQQFMGMEWTAIVATSHVNDLPLLQLKSKYKPSSRIIRQIANLRELPVHIKNILLAMHTKMPPGTNYIKYHPEHHEGYGYTEMSPPNFKIKSFFNYMKNDKVDRKSWETFHTLLPEYSFFHHGADSDHGPIPQSDLPACMSDAMFIWHTKPAGGCGFTLREAMACGRPVIVNTVYSKRYETPASKFLVDGVNCIDINPSVRSLAEAALMVRQWSKPDVYLQKCQDVLSTFDNQINFNKEALAIGKWIEGTPA